MMKRTIIAGWLVVAAALMMGMTACSNDDNMTEEPTVPTTAMQGVQVTVSAGLDNGDGATMRADVTEAVVEGKTQRTLKFTTGDRLYIWRYISGNFLTGILTMDDEPTADGLGATFSGTLKAYDGYGHEITDYNYTSLGSDPLTGSTAILIPSGAAAGCFYEANHLGVPFVEQYSLAADVNTLMKTALYVAGTYNDGSGYTLTKQKPILNCNLGGLKAGTTYSVTLGYASNQSFYESGLMDGLDYTPTVTADNESKVHFAISGVHDRLGWYRYWFLRLVGGGNTYDYIIGQKQFEAKVYNMTRAAPQNLYNQAGSTTGITSLTGYDESTWSQQSYYGLCKFSCSLAGGSGQESISGAEFSPVTVTVDGQTYTLSSDHLADMQPATGGPSYRGFKSSDVIYMVMLPVSTCQTVTFSTTVQKYNSSTHSYDNITYSGTVESFSITGGEVINLGTVELVKTTN